MMPLPGVEIKVWHNRFDTRLNGGFFVENLTYILDKSGFGWYIIGYREPMFTS